MGAYLVVYRLKTYWMDRVQNAFDLCVGILVFVWGHYLSNVVIDLKR